MPTSSAAWEAVIGLEVHAQMKTASKAFCSCSTEFGLAPNSNTCPICLGHPGALPVLNRNLVEFIVRMGAATHCEIRRRSTFARKNYFYPDLPKGYQISQYDDPICHDGFIEIELSQGSTLAQGEERKRIGITRIHMEEDAGKSIHDIAPESLIDLNRSGVPLIEIVSEPDMRTAAEAYAYLTQIKQIVTYLGICDGIMEEGSLRCDANVSVRHAGEPFGTKVEVKNLNSFRNVERAITYEIARQSALIDSGGTVVHETLLWDAGAGATRPMRTKEMAHDYRYFPEPDLVPVFVDEPWLARIERELPEMPLARKERFIEHFALPAYDAAILTEERELADYFETAGAALKSRDPKAFKQVANWIITDILRVLNAKKIGIAAFELPAAAIAELVDLYESNTISSKIAKDVFAEMLDSGRMPGLIVTEKGLLQNSDTGELETLVAQALAANPDAVAKYRAGKTNLFGFLVGQVIKSSGGKANPKIVGALVKKRLDS